MSDGPLFAVTTRSRLKKPWLFPSMMIATRRVRRQLADDPTVVRWASVVAGPKEFWTITVWRSRHDMHEFMRSGAHDDIMWDFSKLLRSFWLMRWRPSGDEIGNWNGIRLSGKPTGPGVGTLTAGAGGGRGEDLEKALVHLPYLAAAMGPDGRASYEHSAFAKRQRAEVGGAAGLVVHLGLPRWQAAQSINQLRKLRTAALDAGAARAAVGLGRPGEAYLLALWTHGDGLNTFVGSSGIQALTERWGERFWLSTWAPENEFGHWDGLRVRRRRRPTIAMPDEAARLGS